MPRTPEHFNKTAHLEHARVEKPFFPAAIEILQQHDTDILQRSVLQIAQRAPHVDHTRIEGIVGIITTAYAGRTRKYVDEAEVNHAYQVALLTAQRIGLQNLQHDTLAIALGHDLDEDTAHTASELIVMTSPRIYIGIDALSHHTNGVPIYPGALDKRPYNIDLITTHISDPALQLLKIKEVDQLAVGNGPLTASELKAPELAPAWENMTRTKIGEMQLLREMLPPGETKTAQNIENNIIFTQLRLESGVAEQLDSTLQERRRRKTGV